jgi:hypothetical protein
MNTRTGTLCLLVVALLVSLTLAVNMKAQVNTETSTTTGQATHEETVERGEVVYVSGNDLLLKMEDGTIRHFPNVPESARATVDGRELGVHDLKPGMKLQRTITVKTTPQTVTTVQTVSGKVFHVSPPSSVILTLDDGTNQQFKMPKGQKFNVDGQETDAWGLKKGMKISATKIVEEPQVVIEQQQKVTGSMPPPPPAPPADVPILVAAAVPAAAPSAAPAALPKTGSQLELLGCLGTILVGISWGLKAIRTTV